MQSTRSEGNREVYPLPAVVAQTQEGRSNSEFWSALGIAPRPAFSVTVTLTIEPFDQVEEFAAVEGIEITTTSIPEPALAGRVFDHALTPIPAAVVTVVETGAQATSARDGRFVVPGLDFGVYTLRVQAPAKPVEQVAVAYAADHQTHTVVLSGP